MDERLDGVMIKDTLVGKKGLRHRDCVRAGETIEGDSPRPNAPQAQSYKWTACGKNIKFIE